MHFATQEMGFSTPWEKLLLSLLLVGLSWLTERKQDHGLIPAHQDDETLLLLAPILNTVATSQF